MKMSGYRLITSSDLFLFDSYEDSLDVDSKFTITGTVVDIPGKQECCWTISWKKYSYDYNTSKESLCTEAMKCDPNFFMSLGCL